MIMPSSTAFTKVRIMFSSSNKEMERQLVCLSNAKQVINNSKGSLYFSCICYCREDQKHHVYLQTSSFNLKMTPSKVFKDLRKLILFSGSIEGVEKAETFPDTKNHVGELSLPGK